MNNVEKFKKEKENKMKELLRVQKEVSNSSYMIGMYNGMELFRALMMDENPKFLFQNEDGKVIERRINESDIKKMKGEKNEEAR